MKSEQRHQLQQNSLASWLTEVVEWSQRNAPLLLGAIIGVALTYAAVTYFTMKSRESTLTSWNDFFTAASKSDVIKLEAISKEDSGEVTGQLANLMLADTALNNGVEQMSTNRLDAETQLNDAKNKYSNVRERATDPLLKQRATLGLARYFETMGQLDDAKKEYEKLAAQPDGMFADLAQEKIEYLNESGVQAFAAWYQKFRPRTQEPPAAGMPKAGEIDKLPTDEKSFPGATPTATGEAAAPATPAATATPAAAATPSATAQ